MSEFQDSWQGNRMEVRSREQEVSGQGFVFGTTEVVP
jgi:hypothetical protein